MHSVSTYKPFINTNIDPFQILDLQQKILVFAEAGNEFIDHLDKIDQTVNSMQSSISFIVDFQPTVSGVKENAPKSKYRWTVPEQQKTSSELKAENFIDPDDTKEDKPVSQSNDDDILACAANVMNNVTTASASSDTGDDKGQIKEKGSESQKE